MSRNRLVEKEMQKRHLEEMMQEDEKDGLYEVPDNYSILKDVHEHLSTPAHYDNSKGSLYKFAEDHKLNSYEYEVVKRIVRCRKKGEWISDIEKTIDVLKLYQKEQGKLYEGQVEKRNKQ